MTTPRRRSTSACLARKNAYAEENNKRKKYILRLAKDICTAKESDFISCSPDSPDIEVRNSPLQLRPSDEGEVLILERRRNAHFFVKVSNEFIEFFERHFKIDTNVCIFGGH